MDTQTDGQTGPRTIPLQLTQEVKIKSLLEICLIGLQEGCKSLFRVPQARRLTPRNRIVTDVEYGPSNI